MSAAASQITFRHSFRLTDVTTDLEMPLAIDRHAHCTAQELHNSLFYLFLSYATSMLQYMTYIQPTSRRTAQYMGYL